MKRNPSLPYIARDTKKPLVVLGGYEVNQDGGLLKKESFYTSEEHAKDVQKDVDRFKIPVCANVALAYGIVFPEGYMLDPADNTYRFQS